MASHLEVPVFFVFCFLLNSKKLACGKSSARRGMRCTIYNGYLSQSLSLSLSLFSSDCVRILCKKSTNTYHSRERENRKIGRVSATHGSFFLSIILRHCDGTVYDMILFLDYWVLVHNVIFDSEHDDDNDNDNILTATVDYYHSSPIFPRHYSLL